AGGGGGGDAAAGSPSPIAAAFFACRGAFVAMGHGAINRLAKPGRSSGSDAAGRSSSPIASALSACRGGLVAVGLFSGAINVLMLTGSVYMLQIYDRVLPSRSVPTLVSLTIIVIAVYGILGFMDAIRGRMLVRIGRSLDEAMGARVYEAVVRLPLKMRSSADGLQPIRDLEQLRGFLSSLGPTALFDLPWMPLYLGLCFAFHFWIGTAALAGAIVLV